MASIYYTFHNTKYKKAKLRQIQVLTEIFQKSRKTIAVTTPHQESRESRSGQQVENGFNVLSSEVALDKP